MAIDTAAKRLRSLDHEEVWAEAMPIPDATIDTGDRWHASWSYYILTVPATPVVKSWTLNERNTSWSLDERTNWTLNDRNTAWTLEDNYR